MQIGKEEVKLPLVSGSMIIYIGKPKQSTKNATE